MNDPARRLSLPLGGRNESASRIEEVLRPKKPGQPFET